MSLEKRLVVNLNYQNAIYNFIKRAESASKTIK
jgi:hypothetical protein